MQERVAGKEVSEKSGISTVFATVTRSRGLQDMYESV
jgi:hypothetical protein